MFNALFLMASLSGVVADGRLDAIPLPIGDILIEVETATRTGGISRLDHADTGGGKVARFHRANHYAEVRFQADRGTYYIWLRGAAVEGRLSDAAWLRFDDAREASQPPSSDGIGLGNWGDFHDNLEFAWASQAPGLPPLAVEFTHSGRHQIRIEARQAPFILDQIWLSRSPTPPTSLSYVALTREEAPIEEGFSSLFDGTSLNGWYQVGGNASYRVEEGRIIGRTGTGRNSFLRSARDDFGDFELRLQVRFEKPSNSGIQFRSHLRDDNVVFGYQCEVDPSDRAWSGGIYDEQRRGWLFPLDRPEHDAARRALRLDDWNDFTIRAVGGHLQTWVNGTECADLHDSTDAEGFVALQVHAGEAGQIEFRHLRIREFR